MQGYNAYLIGADGHIIRRVELICADDDSAKAEASKLADGYDVELWQGNRMIGVLTRNE